MSCLIQLSQGKSALVDEQDFAALSLYKWHAVKNGVNWYAARTSPHGRVYMHHDVLGRPGKGLVVDHENGDGLDNRRTNLRFASHSQNIINRRNQKAGRAFRGVFAITKSKFVVRIRARGTTHYGGVFTSANQAACVANALMAATQGAFAQLNKVEAANEAFSN